MTHWREVEDLLRKQFDESYKPQDDKQPNWTGKEQRSKT